MSASKRGKADNNLVPILAIPTVDPAFVERPTTPTSKTIPSGRLSSRTNRKTWQMKSPEQLLKQHKFRKVAFKHPTWCLWSNKFIWGLDKTGFECIDCELAVARKFLAQAKLTLCDGMPTGLSVRGDAKQLIAGSKIFTIHLPEGQRRSVMLNPMQKLSEVINKICRDRNWNVSDYVARDSSGNELDLRILLGQIKSFEITFTERTAGRDSVLRPPLLSDVRAKLEAEGVLAAKGGKGWKNNHQLAESTGSRTDRSDDGQSGGSAEDSHSRPKRAREKYDITDSELGIGAFSTVYLASDKITGERVAIKVIEKGDAVDSEQGKKFQKEFQIHRELLHEHIVQFIMMDETAEQYYVVMELVEGGELFDQVIARGQFSEQETARLICQILTALAYMHSKGIAHRDMKPENLLFKDKAHTILKIADFGESKHCNGKSLSTYCGTPDYMAPEIILGQPYGFEVDMWALGCIAYIMMSGFPPFDGENDAEILTSILSVKFDFPSPEWDDYSKHSQDFISRLLVSDRDSRMTSTQALAHPWITKFNTESQRDFRGKSEHLQLFEISESGRLDAPPSVSPRNSVSPRRSQNKSRRSIDFAGLARAASSSGSLSVDSGSPRVKPFDELDLAILQANFNETLDGSKAQLLAAVEVLFRFAASKSISFLCEELTIIQTIVGEIPDLASQRSEFQLLVLKTYWLRLCGIKIYIQTRKDKKKSGGVLNKTRSSKGEPSRNR